MPIALNNSILWLFFESNGKIFPLLLEGLYWHQGMYEEAEPLYLEALKINRQLLGDQHQDVALSLNNLANLYHKQGRLKEAEPLYLEALRH